MNKVYTIIAFFSVGYGERDECNVSNFDNEDSAFKCFQLRLKETESDVTDHNEQKKLFDSLVSSGSNYVSGDNTMLFIRHEDVNGLFVEHIHSWN